MLLSNMRKVVNHPQTAFEWRDIRKYQQRVRGLIIVCLWQPLPTRAKMRKSAYLSKCLVQAFKKISQKQISEKIQNLLKEIYELSMDFTIPDFGKISMHILKFDEFCFTLDFTAPWQCKIKGMVTVLLLQWISLKIKNFNCYSTILTINCTIFEIFVILTHFLKCAPFLQLSTLREL